MKAQRGSIQVVMLGGQLSWVETAAVPPPGHIAPGKKPNPEVPLPIYRMGIAVLLCLGHGEAEMDEIISA